MLFKLSMVLAACAALVRADIKNRCVTSGVLAMSFDDGPSDNTGQLLQILSQKNAKATFHLTTQYLTDPNVQDMVQRIAAGGHLIGLRTEPSWNLFNMNDDQIKASIARQSQVMAQFIGYQPILLRLPYKGYDDRVLRAIEATGAVVTVHNLETYDYTGDANRIIKSFQVSMSLAGPGAGNFISIQHDGVASSVNAVPQIIDMARSMSYKLIKLDECLGLGDLTKNQKPLDGGKGQAAPMEIDAATPGDGPSPSGGLAAPSAFKLLKSNSKAKTSAASSAARPLAYTAALAALVSVLLAL